MVAATFALPGSLRSTTLSQLHRLSFRPSPRCRTARWQHQSRNSTNDREAQVMDMIEEVKEIMNAIEQTNAQSNKEMPNLSVRSVMDSIEEEDWGTDPRGIICDGDGCVIVPVNLSAKDVAEENAKVAEANIYTKEGKAWSLGLELNPGASGFAAKIGGAGWDLAITKDEYVEFINLLQRLRYSVAQLAYQGQWYGKSDKPKLELKSEFVRIQAYPAATEKKVQPPKEVLAGDELPDVPFAIRFVFQSPTERAVSGFWGSSAVVEAVKVLDTDDILNLSKEIEEDLRTEGAGYSI
eukprot:jgi/Botrbrau1/7163/Bobra.0143s0033.1